jgi:hypothetical protein
MKILLFTLISIGSLSVLAGPPQLENLSTSDVEKVGNEFAVNFAHTTVSAPETDGLWGIEVGIMGGTTRSPNLKKVINSSGGEGEDFKSIYHAGVIARAHFPFDIFLEGSILPEREISDVEVSSGSIGGGWNAGAFFGLPLDLAVGGSTSTGKVSFDQEPTTSIPSEATITVDTKTTLLWVGASKKFLFITPYAKVGYAHTQAEIKVDTEVGNGTIFADTNKQNEEVDKNGGYLALGANLQLTILKIGLEFNQMNGVKTATGKLSLDF